MTYIQTGGCHTETAPAPFPASPSAALARPARPAPCPRQRDGQTDAHGLGTERRSSERCSGQHRVPNVCRAGGCSGGITSARAVWVHHRTTSPTAPSQLPTAGCIPQDLSAGFALVSPSRGHGTGTCRDGTTARPLSRELPHPETGGSSHPAPSPPGTCWEPCPESSGIWGTGGPGRSLLHHTLTGSARAEFTSQHVGHRPFVARGEDVPSANRPCFVGTGTCRSPRVVALNLVSPRRRARPGAWRRLCHPGLAQGRGHRAGRGLGARIPHRRARGHPHPGRG